MKESIWMEEGEVLVSDVEYEYESGKVNAIYMHGYSTDEDKALTPLSECAKSIRAHVHKPHAHTK